MRRKNLVNYMTALLEEEKKKMKGQKKDKKDKKDKKSEKPYVEDAEKDEDDRNKKMRQDKGAYKNLSSTGVKDSTVSEEQLEESIDRKIKKEIDAMMKKGKDELEILMAIDKKHGDSMSKRDMEEVAKYISD